MTNQTDHESAQSEEGPERRPGKSEKKLPGTAGARERLRVQRELDRQSAKRVRTLKMIGVVIFVLGIGALVAVAVSVKGEGGSETTQSRPVSTGAADAPVTMTVYEDFRCPGCAQFENTFRKTVDELRDAGKLRVDYHLVSIIDGNMGGHGSQRAAAAAMCAHDENKFVPYHDVLYRNQPPEQQDAFGDRSRLMQLAGKVDGLSSTQFEKCVQDGLKAGRVDRSTKSFLDSGHNSTPTVLLDGEDIFGDPSDPLTPGKLRKMVERKAGRAG